MNNTEKFITECEARLRAATPGPWRSERIDHSDCMTFEIGPKIGSSGGFRFVLYDRHYEDANDRVNVAKLKGDAEFIAHAPIDIAKLLEAFKVMRSALEEIRCENHSDLCQSMKPYRPHYECHFEYADEAIKRVDEIIGGGN